MKYILIILLATFSLQAQQEKPSILSTASMIDDMVSNIVGDLGENKSIVPIGGDPHLYEATPKDAKMVSESDLVFINGLNFEGWIKELIQNSGTEAPMIVVTEGVNAMGSDTYKNSFDPHAWMDVGNALIYCKNIRDGLIENFPEHAETFNANFNTYTQQLKALDEQIKLDIQKIPASKRILITSHDAFAYYGKKYGIKVEAIMGISTEADARTSDVVRVSKAIKESQIPAIFIESTINPKLIKQLADDNGVAIGGELFADSLGEPGSEAGTYIGMMQHNTNVIVNALAKGEISSTKFDDEKGKSSWPVYLALALGGIAILFFAVKKMNI